MRQTARDASSGASATQVAGAAKIFGDNDKGDNIRAYQSGEQCAKWNVKFSAIHQPIPLPAVTIIQAL
jgi:hypothetical protein